MILGSLQTVEASYNVSGCVLLFLRNIVIAFRMYVLDTLWDIQVVSIGGNILLFIRYSCGYFVEV